MLQLPIPLTIKEFFEKFVDNNTTLTRKHKAIISHAFDFIDSKPTRGTVSKLVPFGDNLIVVYGYDGSIIGHFGEMYHEGEFEQEIKNNPLIRQHSKELLLKFQDANPGHPAVCIKGVIDNIIDNPEGRVTLVLVGGEEILLYSFK